MRQDALLIVGAGPTGMTAAIEARRMGLDVRIVDRSDHMARWSQALVVQARTLEQFQRYGLAEEVVRCGRKLTGGHLWSEGKQIASVRLDKVPSRYPYALFIPQTETEAILNAHMESLGVQTERQVELVHLEQTDGAVRARLRHADGREEEVEPRWLLGCDGSHSTVRDQLGIPFEGKAIALNFILGDMVLDGPEAPGNEIEVHFHRGDLVFMGRLNDRVTRVIMGTHGMQDTFKGRELTPADFQGVADRCGVRVTIHGADWMTPFNVNDRQAKHYRVGRVFLAGDASHIHSPVGGQGMNTGIQDAANLVWKLAAVGRGADESLLDSYEEERGEVGRALLQFTERVLQVGTASERWVESLRDLLVPLITRLNVVQEKAGGFVSQTAIQYRRSSAVVDAGGNGTLRAGDRMPDLTLRNAEGERGLLADWTEPVHLLVLVNASDGEASAVRSGLFQVQVTQVSEAELSDDGRHQLGLGKKLLIVRPDGYVGYRGPVDSEELARYARREGLQSRASA